MTKLSNTSNNLTSPVVATNQAARYLGISSWSLRKIVREGLLPVVADGIRWRFMVSDLNDYLNRNRVTL